MDNTHVYIWQEANKVVVDWCVIERVAGLLNLQREFFKKRDKRHLQECKRREEGFLSWYEDVREALVYDGMLKG